MQASACLWGATLGNCGVPTRAVQHCRRQCRPQQLVRGRLRAASSGSSWLDQPSLADSDLPEAAVEVFPRVNEKDPYKRLGVTREASFEEVQEARNFLCDQYAAHAPSKESIELALDDILQERMKLRHKLGFRPPQRGRRGEAQGDAAKVSVWQQIRSRFEPSVPGTTLVNDGSIFVALGVWAAWQVASSDPTLPLGAAICFCAWKLYDKRSKRNPDGPFWGGNAIWGALVTTVLGLVAGGLLSYGIVQVVPLPPRFAGESLLLFLMNVWLGATALLVR